MYDEVSRITALKLNLDSVANYSSRKGFIYLNYVWTCSSTKRFCEEFLLVTENNLLLELRCVFFIPPTLILLKTKLSRNCKLSKNKMLSNCRKIKCTQEKLSSV